MCKPANLKELHDDLDKAARTFAEAIDDAVRKQHEAGQLCSHVLAALLVKSSKVMLDFALVNEQIGVASEVLDLVDDLDRKSHNARFN